jgi:hypothetical protein
MRFSGADELPLFGEFEQADGHRGSPADAAGGWLREDKTRISWRMDRFNGAMRAAADLRLVGRHVPAIYGPSGDVTWEEANPTYSVEATDRAA